MSSSRAALEQLDSLCTRLHKAITASTTADPLTDSTVETAIEDRRRFVLDPSSMLDPGVRWLFLAFPTDPIPAIMESFPRLHEKLSQNTGRPVLACRISEDMYSILTGHLAGGFDLNVPQDAKTIPTLSLHLEEDGFVLAGKVTGEGAQIKLELPTTPATPCPAGSWPLTPNDLVLMGKDVTETGDQFMLLLGDRSMAIFLVGFGVQGFEEHRPWPLPKSIPQNVTAIISRNG